MAMPAGLVAFPADVELQRFESRPVEAQSMLGKLLIEQMHDDAPQPSLSQGPFPTNSSGNL
jgi:hypothetical protein